MATVLVLGSIGCWLCSSACRKVLTATSIMWLQVVVDAIDPSVIVSQSASKVLDFGSVTEPELTNFSIPLELQIGQL